METMITNIAGVLLLKPDIFEDNRGFFLETYSEKKYFSEAIDSKFVQDNFSHSQKNILRGLHYQINKPQGKLVRVTSGSVYDVALDIRRDSPTFGQHFSTTLDDKNFNQLYMPPGIAHGFYVISDTADFEYKCTDYYHPEDEAGVLFNDPALGIKWPNKNPNVSERDAKFPCLSKIPKERLPY